MAEVILLKTTDGEILLGFNPEFDDEHVCFEFAEDLVTGDQYGTVELSADNVDYYYIFYYAMDDE